MNTPVTRPWRILLLNGPNLNLLGQRETGIYGSLTLADIESSCRQRAEALGVELECYQSNHEGALVERIQAAMGGVDWIIINPAAYTHTSVAIRDALLAVNIPVIEVHLSNIHRREPFRHHSYVSDIAEGVIAGLGAEGYLHALEAGVRRLVLRAGP
ncbi:MAG: type II 3-dehydroquinate dehydratase [Magnetococcales bacterium]|nr:type II 3-dehydroquinate dehydratase [Magnetococcales bacterium]